MNTDRLTMWVEAGMPTDDETLDAFGITEADILELQQRVMDAVAAKMFAARTSLVFDNHDTLQ